MSIIVFIDFDFIYNVIHRFTLYRLTFVTPDAVYPVVIFFSQFFYLLYYCNGELPTKTVN